MDEGEKPFATSRDLKYLKNYSSLGVKKSTRARRAAIAAIFPLCAGINFKTEKNFSSPVIPSDPLESISSSALPLFLFAQSHTQI